jgi:endonuclease/exonuclease/phosphatase family metal-dependent hydrolase
MKLVSLNVEADKHWGLINPFLDAEQADVVCLQEIFEDDAMRLAERCDMHMVFAPMFLRPDNETARFKKEGIAMLSRDVINNTTIKIYHQPNKELQPINETNEHDMENTIRRLLLSAEIIHDEKIFVVATTHFTWTPDGLPRDYQHAAAEKLLAALGTFPEIMFCGDFNMPRSVNDVYKQFAEKYQDAIPTSYASSLDLNIHRAGKDPVAAPHLADYMVDYLFLSKGYQAKNIRLAPGVSDHCAIVATVDLATAA